MRPSTHQKLHVLIVEDEALVALDLEMSLQDDGHEVVGSAQSLKELQAISTDTDVDLALVDIQLTEGDSGLDACRIIHSRWPNALVVYVTANSRMVPEDFAGGVGVIAKPFSSGGFTSAIAYLEEAIHRPPPNPAVPYSLVASPAWLHQA